MIVMFPKFYENFTRRQRDIQLWFSCFSIPKPKHSVTNNVYYATITKQIVKLITIAFYLVYCCRKVSFQ